MIELFDNEIWDELVKEGDLRIEMVVAFLVGISVGLVAERRSEDGKLNLEAWEIRKLWNEIGEPRSKEMLERFKKIERETMS